jgi:hypothetical protein
MTRILAALARLRQLVPRTLSQQLLLQVELLDDARACTAWAAAAGSAAARSLVSRAKAARSRARMAERSTAMRFLRASRSFLASRGTAMVNTVAATAIALRTSRTGTAGSSACREAHP